jgi:hypothetical protein
MSALRWEIDARIEPGVCEHLLDGASRQLVTVCLFDAPDDQPVTEPVATRLRPSEARNLAFDLLELAEHADRHEAR